MRIALSLAAFLLAAGCHQASAGDNVRQAYDTKADAIENQAAVQPNATAQKIYQARADAIREEGKDREKGMEGREPSHGLSAAGAKAGGDESQSQPPQ